MKLINYLAFGLLTSAVACHSVSDQKKKELIDSGKIAAKKIKEVDSAKLIIPGERAGLIYLGEDMQNVFKQLGNADDGDAAMGSALAIWYTKSSADSTLRDPITIFSSYRDSNMVVKIVKQLSVSATDFTTKEGVHTGFKLKALQAVYPSLKKAESYVNDKNKDTLTIYDDTSAGIAFDIHRDTCLAITVHPKNKAVNSTYLPVHPGWSVVR